MGRTDRAICEDDRDGFIKIVAKKNGGLLGATAVNARAGETITEVVVAIKQDMNLSDLAGIIHAYPTYSTAVQQLAAELAIERTLAGASGKVIRGLSKIIR
jgi:pyruvate/2-oxoglutarate dehydrogenase complex dihydrolipoamide dehydrogenase (E3) component